LHYTGATPGFTLGGNARDRLVEGKPSEAAGAAARTSVLLLPKRWGRYDLSLADPHLEVTIDPTGATPTVVDVDLAGGPYADAARNRVTVEEVRRVIAGALAGSIYRSTDNGHTWEERTDPRFVARPREVEAIAGHPTDRNKVWIGFNGWRATVDDRNLYRTSDNGETWQPTGGPLDLIRAIEIDPASPDTMYVAQFRSGVLRSTDGGDTFSSF